MISELYITNPHSSSFPFFPYHAIQISSFPSDNTHCAKITYSSLHTLRTDDGQFNYNLMQLTNSWLNWRANSLNNCMNELHIFILIVSSDFGWTKGNTVFHSLIFHFGIKLNFELSIRYFNSYWKLGWIFYQIFPSMTLTFSFLQTTNHQSMIVD